MVNFTDQKMTLGKTPVWFSLEEWSKLSSEHGKNFVTFESGLLLRNEGFTPQMVNFCIDFQLKYAKKFLLGSS